MGKKRISEEAKLKAVMDLLSGAGSHAEICTRYGISQTYLYKLKDKGLEGMKMGVSNGRKQNLSREERLESELAEAKRFDMPGFRPNDYYIYQMQRYGILPKDLGASDPIDVYAADRAYWRSFWYRPLGRETHTRAPFPGGLSEK